MDLLTVYETAAILKVNPITVRRYIQSGRLPAVRIGRRVRVHRDAVEALATPIVPGRNSMPQEQFRFHPPAAEEIARRRALFRTIVANREQRRIAPLTSADLVHLAREQEEQNHDEH